MPKIRVLIVDDAVVMRRMISEALSQDPDIEIVGVAANGKIALAKIPQTNPDLITMDVEMPEMDGLQTVRALRPTYPKLPVIMFSTLTLRGAATTLDAISAGATDYVTKPANVGSVLEGIQRLRDELIPKIKTHTRGIVTPASARPIAAKSTLTSHLSHRAGPPSSSAITRIPAGRMIEAIALGTSTGGPNALAEVFATLPGDLGVPILLVQHMPPLFTAMLAERLGKTSPWIFHEATHGQAVLPNHVYVAPGGKHMEVIADLSGKKQISLHEGPPENSCRPAVDVLFRSMTKVYGGRVLAVILTGMGHDGLRGCQHLSEAGADIIAQDEPSSVVWGMPGAVVEAGLAAKVLPLSQVAAEIATRVRRSAPKLGAA